MTRDDIIKALDWHAPTVEAGPQSLLRRIESLVAQAEAAEREACAKVCFREAAFVPDPIDRERIYQCAAIIRARSKE